VLHYPDKQQIDLLLNDPAVRVKQVAKRFSVIFANLHEPVGVATP
jgi:transposase-like protein